MLTTKKNSLFINRLSLNTQPMTRDFSYEKKIKSVNLCIKPCNDFHWVLQRFQWTIAVIITEKSVCQPSLRKNDWNYWYEKKLNNSKAKLFLNYFSKAIFPKTVSMHKLKVKIKYSENDMRCPLEVWFHNSVSTNIVSHSGEYCKQTMCIMCWNQQFGGCRPTS